MRRRAILLSGGVNFQNDYPRYANDLGFAYKVLTECCGYKSNDITVLYSYGKCIDYCGQTIDTHIASKNKLSEVLKDVSVNLEDTDELVLLVSNHGDNELNGLINLWNQQYIVFDELAEKLKQIKARKIIVLGECYAGNFIRNDIENCCIIAGNEAGRYTYVHLNNTAYDEFLYNFLSFLYGKYPDTKEKIEGADVDIEKAFEFAVKNDAFNPENPSFRPICNRDGGLCVEIPQMFTNIADMKEVLKAEKDGGVAL